jgi:hypothetical protein
MLLWQVAKHHQGAANDPFRQEVDPALAGIFLRVPRVLRFHILTYCPHHLAAFAAWANESYRPGPVRINLWVSSENLQAVLLDDRQ